MNSWRQVAEMFMQLFDEGSPIRDAVVAYRMEPGQVAPVPITASEFWGPGPIDATFWASRDVQDAHYRFRRYYLGNGKTLTFCRCMAHVEPHLHAPRRLRRIGHLPMMTMKELPE